MIDPWDGPDMVLKTDYDYALDEWERETGRADEAERVAEQMAHAFKEADPDGYAAFCESEPNAYDVTGVAPC